MTTLTVASSSAMEELGLALAGLLRAGDLVVLTGPLGAGKTTLTRGIGRGLGVRGQVASPTFVLARTHPSLAADGVPLVHVDAYRLGFAAELDDLDLDYAPSVVVVEWGEGLLDGVAESWLDVRIERPVGGGAGGDDGSDVATDVATDVGSEAGEADEPRVVTLDAHGPRWSGVALPA
ncbi:MAG: tRNA threonylcarbamoyladenosine biosynthesis protein TsaE [Frondihabitans sp.]|nr:tRNA threonylcarbamoyladenosine biosynthesis protein TsaE [Frondihabitans sp.]